VVATYARGFMQTAVMFKLTGSETSTESRLHNRNRKWHFNSATYYAC